MRSSAFSQSPPADNRGAALIIALLIVAAVTGLAVNFAADFQLSSSRGENRWHGAQAREYLLAGEDYGVFALNSDSDKELDTLADDWAIGLERTPIEGGWIEGTLEDAQGRFNLNSLATKARPKANAQPWERYTPAQRRFMRLLQTFDDVPIDQTQAQEITNAVIDWLDDDGNQTFGFGGAESSFYQDSEVPYRAANQLMKSASELRLVKNVTPQLFRLLEPFIVALPSATDINVNTASPRIFRIINRQDDLTPLTELDGENMVEERVQEGFKDLSEFLATSVPQQISQGQNDIPQEGLSVNSEFYILRATAEIGRQRRQTISLVMRDPDNNGDAKIVQRSDSGF